MRRALALLLVLLCGAAGAAAEDDATLRAGVFAPARSAPDFSLRGSDGRELTLGRYRGRIVVLAFGFTSCPDVCPTTLAVLAAAHRKLGGEGGDLGRRLGRRRYAAVARLGEDGSGDEQGESGQDGDRGAEPHGAVPSTRGAEGSGGGTG